MTIASLAVQLADPAIAPVIVLGAAACVIAGLLIRSAWRARQAARKARDPLAALFNPDILDQHCATAARRPRAPLWPKGRAYWGHRARTDALAQRWDMETREEALSRIAEIMRGGLASDAQAARQAARYLAGEGFIILDHHSAAATGSPVEETSDFASFEEIALLPSPAPAPAPARKRAA